MSISTPVLLITFVISSAEAGGAIMRRASIETQIVDLEGLQHLKDPSVHEPCHPLLLEDELHPGGL